MTIGYLFDDPVDNTFSPQDVILQNLTTFSTIDPSLMELMPGDATIFLQFPGFAGGVLPDGDYRATLDSSGITDTAGNTLLAATPLEFFFKQGDATRDRAVNLADFNRLAANFGQSDRLFSQGDLNYDGAVNLADFNILAAQFGTSLAPARAADQRDTRFARDRDEDRLPLLEI